MEIRGKVTGEITDFHVKWNKSNDGTEATVDVEFPVAEEHAEELLGEDFKTMAFSTMRVVEADVGDEDDVDTVGHLVDSIKPGRRVVFQQHIVKLEGQEIRTQPKMLRVGMVDGERKVMVKLRLPIDTSKASLVSWLVGNVGKAVKAEFNPQQATFEFRAAVANGASPAVA